MNIIQMLSHLLKNTHGMQVKINMNGCEVDIFDSFDGTHLLLLGKSAKLFITEWNNHEKH
jgi:hypothetical protein